MRAWLDVSAGVAGDMLLGALVDAGAPLVVLQDAVDRVVPGAIRMVASEVMRAGLRALQVVPMPLLDSPPYREWASIRALLAAADLPDRVAADALLAFGRLAEAEAEIHGVDIDSVHFHEVGALDAIADVVGTCAALHYLGVDRLSASPIALGSGTVRAAHGELPVPVPAVLAMVNRWQVRAGGEGELATPTGVALVTALARDCGPMPDIQLGAVGVGAGSKDFSARANVVRVVLGAESDGSTTDGMTTKAVVVEANVDDLDPRVWPRVLERLLEAGAWDAWLTPILMKKGRPAHTVHALTPLDVASVVSTVMMTETSTIGLRQHQVDKVALSRTWVEVTVDSRIVRIKVAHDHGRIVQATPEFDDVAALAREVGRPLRAVLDEAVAAAVARGLSVGARWSR